MWFRLKNTPGPLESAPTAPRAHVVDTHPASVPLPRVALLRQTAPQPAVQDIPGETRRLWLGSRFAGRIRRGDRVAVAVGSRGIANLSVLVRATLDALQQLGAR